MRCWIHSQGASHGLLNLKDSLMRSCNIYMFETAQKIGYEPIYEMAKQFGIGHYAGLFPELNSKYVHKNSNMAICQKNLKIL